MSNAKPTRPGWWWRGWPGDDCPPWVVEIDGEDGELFQARSGELVDDDGGWLAPVPSPAACAAVARLAAAIQAGDRPAMELERARLAAAIVAELDGDA